MLIPDLCGSDLEHSCISTVASRPKTSWYKKSRKACIETCLSQEKVTKCILAYVVYSLSQSQAEPNQDASEQASDAKPVSDQYIKSRRWGMFLHRQRGNFKILQWSSIEAKAPDTSRKELISKLNPPHIHRLESTVEEMCECCCWPCTFYGIQSDNSTIREWEREGKPRVDIYREWGEREKYDLLRNRQDRATTRWLNKRARPERLHSVKCDATSGHVT